MVSAGQLQIWDSAQEATSLALRCANETTGVDQQIMISTNTPRVLVAATRLSQCFKIEPRSLHKTVHVVTVLLIKKGEGGGKEGASSTSCHSSSLPTLVVLSLFYFGRESTASAGSFRSRCLALAETASKPSSWSFLQLMHGMRAGGYLHGVKQ